MHREFRELLDEATGTSEHVIVIVVDIRGFSSFCQKTESFDVANYIRAVYTKIIDNYFPQASYYKPTGDGLLVVFAVPSKNFKEFIIQRIHACLSLLNEFENIVKDDPLINFETPSKIGIGVARGSACRISSNAKTLDYSGRVLNLTARLMDVARPSGIVLDSSIGFNLLPKEIQNVFLAEDIYVRGIAEETSIHVYYSKQHTIISSSYKKPLKGPSWKRIKKTWTYKTIREWDVVALAITLDPVPSDPKQVYLEVSYDVSEKRRCFATLNMGDKGITYERIADKSYLHVDREILLANLAARNLKDDDKITLEAIYPE
jgi:class 3 adenylate cyclase